MPTAQWQRLNVLRELRRSLIHVGLHSNEDRHLLISLSIAKALLSIGSGWTTYVGLTSFAPSWVALAFTIAIQALIFVTASRISDVIRQGQKVLPTIAIYLVAMSASVTFSYVALYDTLYTINMRRHDRVTQLQNSYDSILRASTPRVTQISSSDNNKFALQLRDRIAPIASAAAAAAARIDTFIEREKQNVDLLQHKLAAERERRPIYLPNRIDHEHRLASYEARLERSTSKLQEYRAHRQNVDKIAQDFGAILSQGNARTEDLEYKCLLAAPTIDFPPTQCKFDEAFVNGASKSRAAGDLEKGFSSACRPMTLDSSPASLQQVRDCAQLLRKHGLFTADLERSVADIANYDPETAHGFTVAYAGLIGITPLSLTSAWIAILIDVLILLCGILGSRPVNFLDIRKHSELLAFADVASTIVLQVSALGADAKLKDPVARRALEILRQGVPVREAAMAGYGLLLPAGAVVNLKMDRELALWASLQLWRPVEDIDAALVDEPSLVPYRDGIAIRTRLMLWLCDQVVSGSDAATLDSAFEHDIAGVPATS
jgi:hypothetical protein